MNPIQTILEWFPSCDFAVLDHGLLPHGRDYSMLVQANTGADPGTHLLQFTHVVAFTYVTAVRDEIWPKSWDDDFVDYEKWKETGERDGYLWGTNWSLAYPGISEVEPSSAAEGWSQRLGKPMYEIQLETDRFRLSLVFHDIRHKKVNAETSTVSQAVLLLNDA